MVIGAMELLLGAETGNCSFAVLPTPEDRMLLLEAIFILETIAAPQLHADRFLPPTPVRMVITHKLLDVTAAFNDSAWETKLVKGLPHKLTENADIARRVLPAMLRATEQQAESKAVTLRAAALKEMNHLLGHEVQRLQSLAQVNDHIRPQEIQLAQTQQQELTSAIQQSRLRLDSLRLIWRGSLETLM